MAIDLTLLANDIDQMIADLPLTVTFAGNPATGTRSSLRREFILISEGLQNRYRFSVYLPTDAWIALPDVDDVVTIGGIDYRVLSREFDNIDQLLRLDLGEEFAS